MNSIERFQVCMQHQSPDRPPMDLGATGLTGMRPGCQKWLVDLLGFSGPARSSNSGVFVGTPGLLPAVPTVMRTVAPTTRVVAPPQPIPTTFVPNVTHSATPPVSKVTP